MNVFIIKYSKNIDSEEVRTSKANVVDTYLCRYCSSEKEHPQRQSEWSISKNVEGNLVSEGKFIYKKC